ncbi:MAG: 3-oxoacyl-[acyl-carrier-protein] synthase III C-terminal domain-containing protein [Nanoarchaeota archaeon]|nr:3-oxoacyl-[acyl-carrier-protein] synthase III C-terminal domain-containing protein [Nanoarchaeota archaeon]
MSNAKIMGTGYYVPEHVLDNKFFERLNPLNIYGPDNQIIKTINTSDSIIRQMMGIKERRMASNNKLMVELGIREKYLDIPDQDTADLGAEAAKKAIKDAGISVESIDGIIVSTMTNLVGFPSAAAQIQEKIGAVNACECYDIAAACAGYCLNLDIIRSRTQTNPGIYLAVAAEHMTSIIDYTGANSALFGDGAGAAVIGPSQSDKGILYSSNLSDPFGGKLMYIYKNSENKLRMPEGNKVMLNAVKKMYSCTEKVMQKAGWSKNDVDLYIPHQANIRIIDSLGAKLFHDYDKERKNKNSQKIYCNIDRYGNISAACCAVALAEAREKGIIKDGSKVILTAIGSGLQTSAVAIQF